MGRLFQYNRFGSADRTSKKDNKTGSHADSASPEMSPSAGNCPAYAELYPACDGATASATTTSTSTALRTTTKSVELAIKKYQQWSSKFLPATTIISPPSFDNSRCPRATIPASPSCSYAATIHRLPTAKGDREALLESAEQRRPRVYDCMKDFLRKRLFQQESGERDDDDWCRGLRGTLTEDATSDYEEADDLLECSYNADDEDANDCSSNTCSTSTSCCSESDNHYEDHEQSDTGARVAIAIPANFGGARKVALSLNCWQNAASSSSSSSSSSHTSSSDECVVAGQRGTDVNDDNDDYFDDGIPDCCQLIGKKCSSRRCSTQAARQRRRSIARSQEQAELLSKSWYQPRITSKAAVEHLQRAAPGSFLVRRRAQTFELCLRTESKVKRLAVVGAPHRLRLKGARKEFSSLLALVTHHSVMAEQLPVTLTLPRATVAAATSTRCADDFDTFESLQILGILKSLQAKSFDFS